MATVEAVEARFVRLEAIVDDMAQKMGNYVAVTTQKEQEFKGRVDAEVENVKKVIEGVHEASQSKSHDMNQRMQDTYQETKSAFDNIMIKMAEWERWSSQHLPAGGDRHDKVHYYIPTKNLLPEAFKGELSKWKQWKEDVEDYFDTINKGMENFLKDIEAEDKEPIDGKFVADHMQLYGPKVTGDSVQVWRALKNLTSDEARRIISSVKNEDGFLAWKQLVENYEKGADAKVGVALAELSGMVMKPARNPSETRNLINELEIRKKVVEDLTSDSIHYMHYKSVMLGILDPTTRQHTANIHSTKDMKLLKQIFWSS